MTSNSPNVNLHTPSKIASTAPCQRDGDRTIQGLLLTVPGWPTSLVGAHTPPSRPTPASGTRRSSPGCKTSCARRATTSPRSPPNPPILRCPRSTCWRRSVLTLSRLAGCVSRRCHAHTELSSHGCAHLTCARSRTRHVRSAPV
eukprot:scaffold76200_cov63-Phaeocystis_antarctica.AAC.5